MTDPVELVVVGAGPAGIEAAISAANAGVDVALVDANFQSGGQYFIQLPVAFSSEDHTALHAQAEKLFLHLKTTDVYVITGTIVWGVFLAPQGDGWYLALSGPDAPNYLHAKMLILATGAYDRSIAFPGWTLPGVITAGAVQVLIKNQRILPGQRFLLSGSGPLQLAVAAQLVRAGARVVGLLESSPGLVWRGIRHLPAIWGQWARLREGIDYGLVLAKAKVPVRFGWAVIEASGESEVEAATIARIDHNWHPIAGTEENVAVDTVVVGYGLVPSIELGRLLECRHIYEPQQGSYLPLRYDEMQMTMSNLFAVGDGAGIGGAELARIEGHIAGVTVAQKLGYLEEEQAQAAIAKQKNALSRERRFAKMLSNLFTPGPGLYTLVKEDTLICRCEGVTLGQIREAITDGAQSVSDVKNITRCGMGNCQGRVCSELIARIIAAETGNSIDKVGTLTIRPPIHPIPLSVLENA